MLVSGPSTARLIAFSSWRDNAPALSRLLGRYVHRLVPSAAADAVEAQLQDLIADAAAEHQTLLVGAEIALLRAGDSDRMRELFDKARAAAEERPVIARHQRLRGGKAMAESGETEAARRVLETIQRLPEWATFLSEQPSDRRELDEAIQETAAAEEAEEEAAEEGGRRRR